MAKDDFTTLAFQAPIISQNIQAIMRGVSSYVRLHANWHLRITNESLDRVLPELKRRGVNGAFILACGESCKEGAFAQRCGAVAQNP
jgi:hypothetical protein